MPRFNLKRKELETLPAEVLLEIAAAHPRSRRVKLILEILTERSQRLREENRAKLERIATEFVRYAGSISNQSRTEAIQKFGQDISLSPGLRQPLHAKLAKSVEATQTNYSSPVPSNQAPMTTEEAKQVGKPPVESLIAALYDADPVIRMHTIQTLAQLGEPAVEFLTAALHDAHPGVRQYASEALGEIGDARAVEPLITALHDTHVGVRWRATEALAQLGEPAVEFLTAALHDADPDVPWRAAQALAKIKEPADPPLIGNLRHADPQFRWRGAEAFGELGEKRLVAYLIADLCGSADIHAL